VKIGEGACFPHGFPLVINGAAEIGRFCIINPNVLIGGNRKVGKSPTIGDFCYIGNGAKLIGDCKIGDWCFIAPGAVVTKDIPSESVVGFGFNNIISSSGRNRVLEYLSERIKVKVKNDDGIN
jgi:serine O-acetyltransferase